MKIYKKLVLIVLALLFLILSAFLINEIYAKYLSSASGNASIPISRWNITVNTVSIKENSDISAKITPTFPGNSNIASNIIAPTAEGYFDLDFDFKDVDVSFKYDINVSADESSAVKDIVATGYSIDGGEKVELTNFSDTISDTIYLTDEIDARSIRIYVMWNDDPDTASMNNIDDTESTLASNSSAVLNVSVSFTQIVQ
ncbi:MAG: hypothetical protein ACI4VQ_03075 [Clostridia bacterium]